MSIYDVDFSIQAKTFIRPKYRLAKVLSFLKNILCPLDWLRLNRLYRYKFGYYDIAVYDNSATYSRYDLVIWSDGGVYMRFTIQKDYYPDGTMPTDGYAAGNPPPSKYWIDVSKSFVGTDERFGYTCQLLSMEYRMNRWFGTLYPSEYPLGFWPSNYPDKQAESINRPRIFIGNGDTDPTLFFVGIDETESSIVGTDSEMFIGIDFVGLDTDSIGSPYSMIINYPLSLIPVSASEQSFTELASSDSRLKQLESLVKKSKHISISHAYTSY